VVTLALDTSHAVGSVALARDGALLGSKQFREPATHLVALGHAVDDLLVHADLIPATIDRLAVVIGPGSFTGLRIGLSFAKGLHAATGVPIVTVDALRLLALPWLAQGRVCAMIDARRGEVYAAVYERAPGEADDPTAARELVAPRALAPGTWIDALGTAPDVFVGTGALAHRERLRNEFPAATVLEAEGVYPSTAHLAAIGHRMRPLEENDIRTLEPLYVRPSGAETVRLRAHARPPEGGDG
jgi:tRNA threonylcarbamoyladenosine biosynthesis protein TsaB